MHHLIYPTKDSYITNQTDYKSKNFGLDEILRIGSTEKYSKVRVYTHTYNYATNTYFDCLSVDHFTGIITGSFTGSSLQTSGSIVGSGIFTSSYFFGDVTGSISGSETGSLVVNSSYTGSLVAFNGSISASSGQLDGYVTGSISASYFVTYTGYLSGSSGKITGYISGSNVANEQEYVVKSNKTIDRALLSFDISSISSSVSDGSITNPQFKLKLKVAKEEELPLSYKIHAFPVSQSWDLGIGYSSDGGSDDGVSWNWRDYYSGSIWYPITSSDYSPTNDYLNTSSYSTSSFERGGGTWYYVDGDGNSVACSQSFNYEASDISMDVTRIVSSWISGSLPNQGFILMSSTENISGSNGILSFFSRDTNTIYSPVLDVMWDDSTWVTGSLSTGSVIFSTTSSGITAVSQTGSSFSVAGGISGIFSASAFLQSNIHYITASNTSVSGEIQQFTGSYYGSISTTTSSLDGYISGSGIFTSSYWSGSVGGASISEENDTGISGSSVIGTVSGSSFTSASVSYFSGSVTSSLSTLSGTAVDGYYLDTGSWSITGIASGIGYSGNIDGIYIFGPFWGTIIKVPTIVLGQCGSAFTASLVTASFTGGPFSGSTFYSYYEDYGFSNARLTGSWTTASILATNVTLPIPSGIDPYAYAYISGDYINGTALGTYTISGSNGNSPGSNSASFYGQMISGNWIGGFVNLQLSGSVFTSSYTHTGSVSFSSSSMSPVNTRFPFVSVIQNLKPEYVAGNVFRINVFGREEHPMKNFNRQTQLSQYLIPKYLPTSSYYSIKDNETEEVIVGFDNYTKLSCDTSGNFFVLDTTSFAQERKYGVLIKVESSGSVYVFDNSNIFKIVR